MIRKYIYIVIFFMFFSTSVFSEANSRLDIGSFKDLLIKIEKINFTEAGLKEILKNFTNKTGINFVIDSDIKISKISMYLSDIAVKDVLISLSNTYGLSFYRVPGTSIIKVGQKNIKEKDLRITKIFKLKYIRVVPMMLLPSISQGSKETISNISSSGTLEGNAVGTVTTSGFMSEEDSSEDEAVEEDVVKFEGVVEAVSLLLSEDGRITYDGRANLLIITDYADRFLRIEQVIAAMDKKLNQVLIKSEIIEITDNINKILGLDYSADVNGGLLSATAAFAQSNNVTFPWSDRGKRGGWTTPSTVDGQHIYGTLSAASLTVVLRALETSTKAKYLSRPRIYTMDGEAAIVDVSVDTVTSASTVTDTSTSTSTVSYARSQTGLVLKLTPFITGNKEFVSMFIEPSVSRAGISELFPGAAYDIYTRRLRTKVRVKNGDAIALGGLYQRNKSSINEKIPILGDIPFLGTIFKNKKKQNIGTELLIFVTPYIIDENNAYSLHKKHTNISSDKSDNKLNKDIKFTKKEKQAKQKINVKKEAVKLKVKSLSDKIKEYEAELRKEPENVNAISNLGVSYAKAGRYDDAIAQFKKAILLEPSSGAAYNNLGNLYRIKKEYGAAISCLRRAVRLVPDHPYAYTTLGLCYEMKDMFDEARQAYRNAVKYVPNISWTNTARSRLEALEG